MATKKESVKNHSKLVTARQVADFLEISTDCVWRFSKRRENPIPTIRFGGRNVRFRLSDVEQWLDREANRTGAK